MSSTSLERVVRPYGQIPFSWGNVFETSVNTRGASGKDNIAILTVQAKTSVQTTEIKGASWRIKIKNEYLEVDRQEVEVTIPNPDDPTQSLKTKAMKALTVKDTSTGANTTWHLKSPDPNNPLNATIPASLNDATPSAAPSTPVTPPSTPVTPPPVPLDFSGGPSIWTELTLDSEIAGSAP